MTRARADVRQEVRANLNCVLPAPPPGEGGPLVVLVGVQGLDELRQGRMKRSLLPDLNELLVLQLVNWARSEGAAVQIPGPFMGGGGTSPRDGR